MKTKIGHVSLMCNTILQLQGYFSYCFVVTKSLNASGRNSHKKCGKISTLFYSIKHKYDLEFLIIIKNTDNRYCRYFSKQTQSYFFRLLVFFHIVTSRVLSCRKSLSFFKVATSTAFAFLVICSIVATLRSDFPRSP